MYRPVTQDGKGTSIKETFFGDSNYHTLHTVLVQDLPSRHGITLTPVHLERLDKTMDHYLKQVYQKQGDKPLIVLNREVLTACSKDFSQYLQRKEAVKHVEPVQTVMNDHLFQETSQRFERLTQERNDVKALPSSLPDFRISLSEDGPPAAEMFERAKKQREREALRTGADMRTGDMGKAEAGLQARVSADSTFRSQQGEYQRNTEYALVQRQQNQPQPSLDLPLAILPDRRELLRGAVGSFDTMSNMSGNGNPTITQPLLLPVEKRDLPQNVVVREERVVSYREIEHNLFIYSADRDWLQNNKENRYRFTVNFDPAANGQSFGPTLASQQKFKNIVRIELVKAILPGEGLSVLVQRTTAEQQVTDTTYQDNILNFPFITVRVEELENNNYGTNNEIDRSFGVLQYDAKWQSDITQESCSRGFLAMIPKFMKCQKEYYPTPLSTLQKMTIDLRRPNGELISSTPDTFDINGILAPQTGTVAGTSSPFTIPIQFGVSPSVYNVMMPAVDGSPANFYVSMSKYFSKFEMCAGDRIQISGYGYSEEALNDPTYGQSLRAFSQWVNRPEGHLVLATAYTDTVTSIRDGVNDVGYANMVVIQARYYDPTTGSVSLFPFGPGFGATLAAFGVSLQTPLRAINLNRQLQLVFRIITREMDSLPQLRPDNNY